MLSRHWIFGDAEGRTKEVKGPGAVGETPVLRPGESWSYDSGTRIQTPTGSMSGSFQFAVLADVSRSGSNSFNARVSRLWLTEERRPVRVPCVDEASIGHLPPTSVRDSSPFAASAEAPPVAAHCHQLLPCVEETDRRDPLLACAHDRYTLPSA